MIINAGNTDLLPGQKVDDVTFTEKNDKVLQHAGYPAVGRPIVLGITKAALDTESFLSAASFQQTTSVLTDAAIKGKVDSLRGLKENVMIGKLIPAGTGINPLLPIGDDVEDQDLKRNDYDIVSSLPKASSEMENASENDSILNPVDDQLLK